MRSVNLKKFYLYHNLQLRDDLGSIVATTDLFLSPNAQIAQFLTEFDWDGSPDLSDFLGTVTLSAPADFAATVILVTDDEFATLPVTPLAGSEALKGSSGSESRELYFAQFGDGTDPGTSISSLIILSVIGGAIIPPVMGLLSDNINVTASLFVLVFCMIYVGFSAYYAIRTKEQKSEN